MISTDEFTRTYDPSFYFYYITEVISKPEDQRPKGLALALDYHEYLHRTIGRAYKSQTPK